VYQHATDQLGPAEKTYEGATGRATYLSGVLHSALANKSRNSAAVAARSSIAALDHRPVLLINAWGAGLAG